MLLRFSEHKRPRSGTPPEVHIPNPATHNSLGPGALFHRHRRERMLRATYLHRTFKTDEEIIVVSPVILWKTEQFARSGIQLRWMVCAFLYFSTRKSDRTFLT